MFCLEELCEDSAPLRAGELEGVEVIIIIAIALPSEPTDRVGVGSPKDVALVVVGEMAKTSTSSSLRVESLRVTIVIKGVGTPTVVEEAPTNGIEYSLAIAIFL